MFATPDTSHLTADDLDKVYEPAEDSFLLLDAIEQEYQTISDSKPCICLEVGCGSGVISTFTSRLFGQSALCLCTDINPHAAQVAHKTAHRNGVQLEPVCTNLVECLLPRLHHQVDLLLFNPPYVVTPSEEVGGSSLSASWAGGVAGREVIDKFMPLLPQLLSETGICYMVVIRENKPDELMSIVRSQGLQASVVISRRSGPEFLSVIKFSKHPPGGSS